MKILVISNNPFSKSQNNGKTIASFFKEVNIDNLAQLYFNMSDLPNIDICNKYYSLSEKEIIESILNLTFNAKNGYSDHKKTINVHKKVDKQKKIPLFFLKNKGIFKPLREILWSLGTWNTPELDEWVKRFKPEIIFSVLGDSIYSHKIVQFFAKRYEVPFVAFFTDDYVINDTSSNFIQRFHYKKLCKVYEKTMREANLVYVIGDKMRLDYEKRFGRKMGTLVNSVNFSDFSQIRPVTLTKENEIIMSFIGGIHLNRWVSISRLGKIITELNNKYKLNIRIKVFCIPKPESNAMEAFTQNGVEYGGGLDQKGVLNEIRKSHFLIHVESFDEKNRLYTKYSVSTKIPEYLASRRRIVAFGPHEVASVSLLQDSGFGCCLTDLDSEESMKKKLMAAIDSYNDFDFQSQYEYALNNFDQVKVGQTLLKEMENILNK